jgi:ABC-type glycerol-3-phosphate transport system substrate-binding protein
MTRAERAGAVCLLALLVLCGCRQGATIRLTMYHWNIEIDHESPICREIEGRLGIEIVPVSASWSEWPEKLNIMIAAGEVPDIFVTYGPGDPDGFERLAADGLLLPLSSCLDTRPNIRRRLEGREDQRFRGEFYAVPVHLPRSDHVGMIRGDWLDRFGLAPPQTVADLVEIARVFKRELGIFPISSSPSHTAGFFWLNPLLYAFGGGWDTWLEREDGSWEMCWVSEGNRRALELINRLYHEGLMDPEFFARTDAGKMDRFLAGKAGIVFHNEISLYTDRLRAVEPTGRLDIFSPPLGPEGCRGQWAMDGFFTAVSLYSGMSETRRDKALALLDFLYSPEGVELLRYGVEGVHFRFQEGRRIPMLPRSGNGWKRLREVDSTASLRDFVELGDIWLPEWDPNGELTRQAVANGERYGRVPPFLYDKTAAEQKYKKQLTDRVFQEYTLLVQSDCFEEDWKTFVQCWYAGGGQEMTVERNQ